MNTSTFKDEFSTDSAELIIHLAGSKDPTTNLAFTTWNDYYHYCIHEHEKLEVAHEGIHLEVLSNQHWKDTVLMEVRLFPLMCLGFSIINFKTHEKISILYGRLNVKIVHNVTLINNFS